MPNMAFDPQRNTNLFDNQPFVEQGPIRRTLQMFDAYLEQGRLAPAATELWSELGFSAPHSERRNVETRNEHLPWDLALGASALPHLMLAHGYPTVKPASAAGITRPAAPGLWLPPHALGIEPVTRFPDGDKNSRRPGSYDLHDLGSRICTIEVVQSTSD